jgi:hypothetical protein
VGNFVVAGYWFDLSISQHTFNFPAGDGGGKSNHVHMCPCNYYNSLSLSSILSSTYRALAWRH